MARSIPMPLLTPLRRIAVPGGDVLHGMKRTDPGFHGFGEAYFTSVHHGQVKGWKRHELMTLNLVVPCGAVRLMVRATSGDLVLGCTLSPDRDESYARLTVPPGHWVAFGGVGPALNLMLNLADLGHDPAEAENRSLESFPWCWQDEAA